MNRSASYPDITSDSAYSLINKLKKIKKVIRSTPGSPPHSVVLTNYHQLLSPPTDLHSRVTAELLELQQLQPTTALRQPLITESIPLTKQKRVIKLPTKTRRNKRTMAEDKLTLTNLKKAAGAVNDLFLGSLEPKAKGARRKEDIKQYCTKTQGVLAASAPVATGAAKVGTDPAAASTPVGGASSYLSQTSINITQDSQVNNSGYNDDVIHLAGNPAHLALVNVTQDSEFLGGEVLDEDLDPDMDQDTPSQKRGRENTPPKDTGKKTLLDLSSMPAQPEQKGQSGKTTPEICLVPETLQDLHIRFMNEVATLRNEIVQVGLSQLKISTNCQTETQHLKAAVNGIREDNKVRFEEVSTEIARTQSGVRVLETRVTANEAEIAAAGNTATRAVDLVMESNARMDTLLRRIERIEQTPASGEAGPSDEDRAVQSSSSAFLIIGLHSVKKYLKIHPESDPVETLGRLLGKDNLYAAIERVIPADIKTAKYRSASNIAIVYMTSDFMKREAIVAIKKRASTNPDTMKDVVIKDSFHPTRIPAMKKLQAMGMDLKSQSLIAKYRIINRKGDPVLQIASSMKERFRDNDFTATGERMEIEEEGSAEDSAESDAEIHCASGSNAVPIGPKKKKGGATAFTLGNSTQPASISTRNTEQHKQNSDSEASRAKYVKKGKAQKKKKGSARDPKVSAVMHQVYIRDMKETRERMEAMASGQADQGQSTSVRN